MKVPFKMPEIFPHTLCGGLESWASIGKSSKNLSGGYSVGEVC